MAKDVLPFVFLDIAIVIVVARLMGRLFVRLRQPAVIGEILGGIVLGPSVLGLLPGNLPQLLFPADVRPHLTVIAQLGLVLFMFIVGLEVDLRLIQSRRRVATTVSLSSIALPFGLGAALAVVLYPAHSVAGPDAHTVPPLAFALFLGAAMSITAFPVLARILTERRMHRTPVGVLALACAAIDDVVAWSLLAVVVAVAVRRHARGLRHDPAAHRGVRAGDARRGAAAAGAAHGALPGGRAPHARRAGRGARRAAAVGVRHRGHRHPRDLRRVRLRRGHAARASPRSPGPCCNGSNRSAPCSCCRCSS